MTLHLGGLWPYLPRNLSHWPPQPETVTPDEEEGIAEVLRWVAVNILKPDYSHESLTVVVSFPCAMEDLVRVVQDARHPEDLRLFPHIFVTNPTTDGIRHHLHRQPGLASPGCHGVF